MRSDEINKACAHMK